MAKAEADHVAANGMARKRAAQSQIDTILSMSEVSEGVLRHGVVRGLTSALLNGTPVFAGAM
jgi:hypothetical protein